MDLSFDPSKLEKQKKRGAMRIPQEVRNKIKELSEQKYTIASIAKAYGISAKTVGKIIKEGTK
ncbi:hypothetical protein AB4259_02765 [Vibrio amylolyticus]|uniref:hypothetical protein n=1 Tax=Vibrio amylolyticus TaxID=2847292 RepID=UPI00354F8124